MLLFIVFLALLVAPINVVSVLGILFITSFCVEKFTKYKGWFKVFHLFEPYGFSYNRCPDLTGKTFIVTGANSGLGYGTAHVLAMRGAVVIMAVRDLAKGEQARSNMGKVKGRLVLLELDNASFASVRRFANAFRSLNKPLHGLILNAGIMAPPFHVTQDGFESQYQVNFLSHVLLIKELLSVFDRTQVTSIVFVSSTAMYHSVEHGVFLDTARINHEPTYEGMEWYGQSKLAAYLYSRALSSRLVGSNIICNAVNPGGVKGDLNRYFIGNSRALRKLDSLAKRYLFWEPEEAALTVVGAAVSPGILRNRISGRYFVPILREYKDAQRLDCKNLSERLFAFTETLLDKAAKSCGEENILSSPNVVRIEPKSS